MTLRSKIDKTVIGILVGGLVGLIGYTIKRSIDNEDLHRAYVTALFQYADKNKDNFISKAEKKEFDEDLFKDKDVDLIYGQSLKYRNGEEVPITTITEWIKNYNPIKLEK